MISRVRAVAVLLAILFAAAWPQAVAARSGDDWKALEREAKRMKIDDMADASLKELLRTSHKAQALYDKSVGWAVFDNLKLAVLISGGGGNGVAADKATGERTYMRMGTVGIGLGLGGKKYQVVFLFQDEQTFTSFVERGWQADASATAVAGDESTGAAAGFVNGLAVFQLTESGLMAHVDIAGTKYWKNKKLNRR